MIPRTRGCSDGLYAEVGRGVPALLRDWDANVDEWCASYRAAFVVAELVQIKVTPAIFIFDQTHERVVVAYGLSQRPVHARDANRMRGFPTSMSEWRRSSVSQPSTSTAVTSSVTHREDASTSIFFRIAASSTEGGHRTARVSEGWSGGSANTKKRFNFHRPAYDDQSWIPAALEYGVLRDGSEWWIETFPNK
jgi:hypothetical protein